MMRPEEVKQPNFTVIRGNSYDAYEVDEYVKNIYDTYIKLLTSNKQYSEKFASVQQKLDDYNINREALSDLLIEAKANAQKTKAEAEKKAKEILDEAREKEAGLIESAKSQLENAEAAANAKYDEIVTAANAKAAEVIENANAQAAKIVGDAYADAQKAKAITAKIVSDGNEKIAAINQKVVGMKTLSSTVFAEIAKLLESIDLPADIASVSDEAVEGSDE